MPLNPGTDLPFPEKKTVAEGQVEKQMIEAEEKKRERRDPQNQPTLRKHRWTMMEGMAGKTTGARAGERYRISMLCRDADQEDELRATPNERRKSQNQISNQ